MKISITDEFLWDLYTLLQETQDIADFILGNRHTFVKFSSLENPVFKKYKHDKNKKKFGNFIYYLKKRGYIKVENTKSKKAIMLTRTGLGRAFKAGFQMEDKVKRKDGKWVMLIFDMPVKFQKSRDLLRSILRDLGFKMFQQSVWISPYDISGKLEKAMQFYSLDKYVKIFLIEEVI